MQEYTQITDAELAKVKSLDRDTGQLFKHRQKIADFLKSNRRFIQKNPETGKVYTLQEMSHAVLAGIDLEALIKFPNQDGTSENDDDINFIAQKNILIASFYEVLESYEVMVQLEGTPQERSSEQAIIHSHYQMRFMEFALAAQAKIDKDALDAKSLLVIKAISDAYPSKSKVVIRAVGLESAKMEARQKAYAELVATSPEAYLYQGLKQLQEMKTAFDTKGKIVETPYVKEKLARITELAHRGDPVFVHGELGAGKTELALHAARQNLSKKHIERWEAQNPEPSKKSSEWEIWNQSRQNQAEALVLRGHKSLDVSEMIGQRGMVRAQSLSPEEQSDTIMKLWEARQKKISPNNEQIFKGIVDGWEVSGDSLFIEQRQPDGTTNILKNKKQIFKGIVDGWEVSGDSLFIEQRQPDGTCIIFKNNEQIFNGELGRWRVSGDSVFIWQLQYDGTSIILKDYERVFHGKVDNWETSGDSVFIQQRQPDGTCIILKNNEQVFKGRLDRWRVSGDSVFIEQPQPDGTCVILKDYEQIFKGRVDAWQVSGDSLFIEQPQPDGTTKILKNNDQVDPGAIDKNWQVYKESWQKYFENPVEITRMLGPVIKAMKEGRPLVIDEMNAIPQHTLIILNDFLMRKKGDLVVLPYSDIEPFKVQEGFCIIATGNYKPEDGKLYIGRQAVDAALLSRFGIVHYDYLPQVLDREAGDDPQALRESRQKSELSLMLITRLLQNDLSLEIPSQSLDKIQELARISRILQNVFSFASMDDTYDYQSGTATVPATEILMENVPSIRHLVRVLDSWRGNSYRYPLDVHLFEEYVQRSSARPKEMHYLYQILQTIGDFFKGPGWPDSDDLDAITGLDIQSLKNNYSASPNMQTYHVPEVLEILYGPAPTRTRLLVESEITEPSAEGGLLRGADLARYISGIGDVFINIETPDDLKI